VKDQLEKSEFGDRSEPAVYLYNHQQGKMASVLRNTFVAFLTVAFIFIGCRQRRRVCPRADEDATQGQDTNQRSLCNTDHEILRDLRQKVDYRFDVYFI
jgi:hypothetical protein